MQIKIIHSNFQINLIDTSFSMVEENNWFNQKSMSKFTYPITVTLTDEQISELNFITEHYRSNTTTVFEVVFFVMEKEFEAKFEIERIVGRKITGQVRYGLEEFPNFDLKLAQLDLHNFELTGESIYEHAETIIAQTWPAVDYNFVQVHTKKLDTDSEQWAAFEGRINNYDGTDFLENEYDTENDLQLNRNVMQPMPYLLYLLKKGFEKGGYTLAGDILNDPEFKKATIHHLSEYYYTINDAEKQELILKTDEYDSLNDKGQGVYETEITIAEPGRYAIAGNLFLRNYPFPFHVARAALYFNEERIGYWSTAQNEKFILLDEVVEVLPGESNLELRFNSNQKPFNTVGGTQVNDATILDITITQLNAYDANGDAIPTLVQPNEINLPKCVPDITFGKLFETIRDWKNYEASFDNNVVTMNKIVTQLGTTPVVDLSTKEIKEPEVETNQGNQYELKFQEINSEDYEFQSVLVDANGIVQSPYTKEEDAEEILIDAIPLPLKMDGGVRTADGFMDDKSKLQIILYNGLSGGINVAEDPVNLLIPQIYENDYAEWIDFLLNSMDYKWTFNTNSVEIKDLNTRSTVYAYGLFHCVKKYTHKHLGRGVISTEIELASLK